MRRGVGAPPGGRVHWFIFNLPNCIKRNYEIRFDYEYHNYTLIRYPFGKRTPRDIFIVIRTSRLCWRCMYYHFQNDYFEYFSEQTSRKIAQRIELTYIRMRNAEFDELERAESEKNKR